MYSSESSIDVSSDDEEIINFVVRQRQVRKEPRVPERGDHFNYWDNTEFYNRFRLSKATTVSVLERITDAIQQPTEWNHALTPMEMLLLTLRFFATGSFLVVTGDFIGVHKRTAGKVISKVMRALADLRPQYIRIGETQEERTIIQREFYCIAKFPRVLGAVDCTHIKIKSPGGPNAEIFRNRKIFFSINVQTVSNSNLEIMDIVARWPGSTHDSTVFRNSAICRKFENGEMGTSVLVGDAGYAVKNYLLTPLGNVNTPGENAYNEAIVRTRNPVERSYGVWKRRFPILSNGINLSLPKVQWIIVATAVLHNIAVRCNEKDPPDLSEDEERAFEAANNVPQQEIPNENNNNVIRNQLIEYFSNL